jgi:hypothetical protein
MTRIDIYRFWHNLAAIHLKKKRIVYGGPPSNASVGAATRTADDHFGWEQCQQVGLTLTDQFQELLVTIVKLSINKK